MRQQEKEKIIARISSGYTPINYNNHQYKVCSLEPEKEYIGQEIYDNVRKKAYILGSYSDDEVLGLLIDKGIWNEDLEKEMNTIEEDIDKIKVKMFQLVFNSNELALSRKYLKRAKERLAKLKAIRHSYDYITCDAVAAVSRSRYFIGMGLKLPNNENHWRNIDNFFEPDCLVDSIMDLYFKNYLYEQTYRELARTDPWRLLWSCRKSNSFVFKDNCCEMTNEQRLIIFWSLIYDNIYENPECPPESVINDDDLLDGWMILQKNNRESALEKKRLEGGISANEKIRNAHEVYVIAETKSDAEKVDCLNDPVAMMTKKRRMAALKQAGQLNEMDMPDTKQRFQMELNKMYTASMRSMNG